MASKCSPLPYFLLTIKIIAHRGASSEAPENTLTAVNLAWEQSADGVEVDLHLTKDCRLAVIHDTNTKRTTGRNWLVSSHTLKELKSLDAGKWKHRKWTGEKIPALEEILTILPANKTMTLEIKCGVEAISPLKQALKQANDLSVAIASFALPVAAEAKKELPETPAYWICDFKKNLLRRGWRPNAEELIKKAKAEGLDGLYLRACGAITPSLVSAIKNSGLSLHVWTVDSPALARKMIQLGVDSITTNRPGWLREKI